MHKPFNVMRRADGGWRMRLLCLQLIYVCCPVITLGYGVKCGGNTWSLHVGRYYPLVEINRYNGIAIRVGPDGRCVWSYSNWSFISWRFYQSIRRNRALRRTRAV